MKKRLLSLVLATSCIFGLVACKDDEKSQKDEKDSKTENYASGQESSDEGDIGLGKQEYIVNSIYKSNTLYAFDENGNKLEEFNVDKLNEYMDKAGYKPDFVSVSAADDGVLYCHYANYDNDDYKFLALDYKTGQVEAIDGLLDNASTVISCCYDGKIYSAKYDFDTNVYQETAYEKDGDDFSFKEVKDEKIEIENHDVLYNGDGKVNLANRMFDDIGFALVDIRTNDKRDGIGKLTSDGKVEKVEGFKEKSYSSKCYNENYFVFSCYDDETYTDEGFFVYDFASGKTAELDIPVDASIIGMQNDTFYYQAKSDSWEDDLDYNIYAYDLDTNKSECIYTVEHVAGAGSLFTYTVAYGDTIYVANVDGEQLKLYKVDKSGDIRDLDCPIKSYSAFKYGTVISDYNEVKCEYCDATLYTVYEEAFVLDDKYSPYAQQINDTLKAKLDAAMAYTPEYDEDDCEYHQDELDKESDDVTVTGVKIINDNYLLVDMDSYWYGGGAHGMPGMWEYIFDLTTGEELTFADFYSGTEEDFKNLVATKVKEDFESQSAEGQTPYYFAETAEDIYNTAYDYVSLDNANILFDEDKVTYYFYPYDLASYADGFQYYEFTYEEILGTNTLTR